MPKFSVEASFSLETRIEPEVSDHHWDNSDVTEFQGNSYFDGTDFSCRGGSISFVVDDEGFEDEDDVESWVKANVIDEGNEVEDNNGITWIVVDLDFEIELLSTPLPDLSEALAKLGEFAEEHREDEEYGDVARSAIVVLAAFGSLTSRVSSLEARIEEQNQRITSLCEKVREDDQTA